MKKFLLGAVGLGLLIIPSMAMAHNSSQKVWICKFIGTPGVNETLKDGKNPISVSENAIKDFQGVGSSFNDAQGRSFVVALVTEDNKDNPPTCPVPTPNDVCKNIEGIQTKVPDGDVVNADGVCTPIPPVNNPPVNTPAIIPPVSNLPANK